MNKHILLVMKWLKDKDSVSQKALEKSKNEAYAANTHAACEVYNAAAAANYDYVSQAVYWVNRYFEETGEDRAQYEKELEK
jgi:hypothetical protein